MILFYNLKKKIQREVRLAMMDRVVGRKGCAFSALIALKLFGEKKRRGWRKNINFDEALDEMLAEESGEDDFTKPYQWKVLLFWLKLFY